MINSAWQAPGRSDSLTPTSPSRAHHAMTLTSPQALNGLLNSFTRAAGAAERVLALVDLEPDIPPPRLVPYLQGTEPSLGSGPWVVR